MKRVPFASLRSRLLFLVLLAVLPALGLVLFTAAEQRELAKVEAQNSALRLARLVAADQERIADHARQLLTTLARMPAVRQRQLSECNELLSTLLQEYPQYLNLGLAAPDGDVVCSTVSTSEAVNIEDQLYFHQALSSSEVVVGAYGPDPLTGQATLHSAFAVRGEDRQPDSVLFAALDLAWLNQLVSESQLPEEAVLLVADGNGRILMRRPDPQNWVGRQLEPSLLALMQAGQENTAEVIGLDGVSRLYAFTSLQRSPGSDLFIGIGISESAAFAGANALLYRQLTGLSLAFLLALAAAWVGGEFFILRRVRSLLRATKRLEIGDLSARTGLPYGRGELSQLARAFDQMTVALQQRDLERKQMENETQRHNRNLTALNEAITAVSASLELPEILSTLKQQMTEKLDVPGGVIFFYDLQEDVLYLEEAWGIPAAVLSDFKRVPGGASHYGTVIKERRAILVPDFRRATPYAFSKLPITRPQWQSYLCVPLQAKGEVQGVLDLFSLIPNAFQEDQIALFTTLGQQVGAIIQNARLFSQVRSGRRRLEILSKELLEVQENERHHLARELHDEIGQALTAVKVNLQAVLRLSGASTNSRYLEESISIIERVLQQVRNLSLDLRPSLLDDLGVVAALRWYIDRQGRRAGFHTEFIADPPEMRLPPALETVCFRVVQEALTNVVRHAVASRVQVHLIHHHEQLELIIRDDGIGFNVAAVRERSGGEHLGLLGMQERVQLVGGRIEVHSDRERGTEIRATFPVGRLVYDPYDC